VHEAHPINPKLVNLYKRREYEARPETDGRIRSPPRDGFKTGILGTSGEQVIYKENHPIHHPPHAVINHSPPHAVTHHAPAQEYNNHAPSQEFINHAPSQEFIRHAPAQEFIRHVPAQEFINHAQPHAPHQNLVQQVSHASTSGVRPDPVDIDEDFSHLHQDISDPEDLQRAFVSGIRQPNQNPMSFQRFRNEHKYDIAPATKNIDQFSDSDYSVVEQAYKDMEDFDTRVDLYRYDIGQSRVTDDRTFRNHK
jgi:hypothetical protein